MAICLFYLKSLAILSFAHIMSSNTQKVTKQSIIQEIDKAFRNVNNICLQYFANRKNYGEKPTPFMQYRNFNNYKHNQKDSQIKNNPKQSIDLIDDDEIQSYKRPQNQSENQQSDSEIDQQLGKKEKPIKIIQSSKSKPQGTAKFSFTEKIPQPRNAPIPPPPKPPLSPYFIFYKQKKDLIKQQFPDMSISELASAAAKVWKSLAQEEKEPYNRKYFEQKRDYEQNMAQYSAKYPNYKQQLKNGNMKKK